MRSNIFFSQAITPGDRFVITSDRDEHIRVSRFPNGYNIETFCLGHTDVVTCIKLLPWNGDILVSAGGDGTLRTWEYLQGKQLSSLDIKQYIKQYTPEVNQTIQAKSKYVIKLKRLKKTILQATDANSVDPIVASIALDEKTESLAIAFAK